MMILVALMEIPISCLTITTTVLAILIMQIKVVVKILTKVLEVLFTEKQILLPIILMEIFVAIITMAITLPPHSKHCKFSQTILSWLIMILILV